MSKARQLIEAGPDDIDPKDMAMQDRIEHATILKNLTEQYKQALEKVADTNLISELQKKFRKQYGSNSRSLVEHYVARTVLWMITSKSLEPGAPNEKIVYRALKSYFPYGL